MLNMIKMDLYRMVRTKSMYVVWIVMPAPVRRAPSTASEAAPR